MYEVISIIVGGLMTGIASGLLGIGGGALLVPLLIYVFKLDIHHAIGTSLTIIIPTAIVGSIVHIQHGNVEIKFVLTLFLFTIVGSILGAYLAGILPALILRRVFAVFLFGIAIKMFFFG